ncbi:MAG: response regulator transcription factor [Opitutaceae bacterium]|nr:response regulator transcription factor [Opitutaceae bacterium]
MKIAVIEDHTLIRDMLMVVCQQAVAGAKVVGAKDAASGLELCRTEKPDLIFLDLALPDRDGLSLLDDLFAVCPTCKVIALSSYTDEFTLHRALNSNVHGFVDKNEQPLEVLGEAIATVMSGQRYFPSVAQRVRASLRNDPGAFDKLLSEWEQLLLGLLGRGLSNAEIAKKTGLSAITVRNHRCRIMAKLGIHSTPELINYATEKGFTRVRQQWKKAGPGS